MSVLRYDRVPLKARYTEDGYLEDSPVLTRTGVFAYRQPDGTIRKEYRPPEEVFHPDSLASYKNKPITKGHPGVVNASNLRQHQIGTLTSEGRRDGDSNVVGDIVIHDPRVVKEDGWKELSLGYRLDIDETPGVSPEGESYDAVQRNIRINHNAVVPAGRAGNAKLNLDAADAVSLIEDGDDAVTPTDDEDDSVMKKVRLDNGIEYDAAPEVAQAYDQARNDAKEAATRADQEKARADAAESKVAEHDKAIEKIRQDAVADARKRLELEATAKQHKVEIKQDSTDRQIKEGVILALRSDAKLEGQSDAYVDATFDIVTQDASARRSDAAEQRRQATDVREDGKQETGGAMSAREKMIARQRGEKVE